MTAPAGTQDHVTHAVPVSVLDIWADHILRTGHIVTSDREMELVCQSESQLLKKTVGLFRGTFKADEHHFLIAEYSVES